MAKKTLKDYILSLKKEHEFTVRIAGHEIDNSAIDRIENNLKRHELIKISKPKKTMYQVHPLGFTEPTNSEVTIFTVKLGLPASSFYLAREIAQILKISEIYVVVNGIDNPVQDYSKKDDKYKAKLSIDPEYPEVKNMEDAQELVGDKRSENMLKTILKDKEFRNELNPVKPLKK